MKKILLLLLVAISFSNCEKDDICTEETTPRLILSFYDISNPTVTKNVVSLKVKADGSYNNLDLGTFNGVSKVALPLNPSTLVTTYHMTLDSASSTNANEDILTINYTTQTVYVSRACGYKTVYQLANGINGVVKTEPTIPDGFWIQDTNVQTTSITTENVTHVKIYF